MPSKISALGSMKKSIRPDGTRDTRPPETPLTDSWQTSIQTGATPGIFKIMWRDGFAVGHGTERKYTAALRLFRYDKPLEHAGKKLFWAIEGIDYAEDLKTVLRIWGQTWFETEEQAKAELPKFEAWAKAEANKKIAAQTAAETHKPSSDEQDLMQARLKVMREQHPDTFKAMDALEKAQPEDRPTAMEALFRAYTVDKVRLHKPAKLGDILPFNSTPDDMSFILEIAKAHRAQSPRDSVDVEIAARWFAAGYDKMSLAEYTDAINAKTGAKLKPDAMEKRRYAKLGLMTKKPPGPPPKF
jgi:hypothetical protein